jgi:hypothetical protein
MKKALNKITNKIVGMHSGISGDASSIRGDVTGISGDVTDISGNVDECELTSDNRKQGVKINDLILH